MGLLQLPEVAFYDDLDEEQLDQVESDFCSAVTRKLHVIEPRNVERILSGCSNALNQTFRHKKPRCYAGFRVFQRLRETS
jgi:hypothetical protein